MCVFYGKSRGMKGFELRTTDPSVDNFIASPVNCMYLILLFGTNNNHLSPLLAGLPTATNIFKRITSYICRTTCYKFTSDVNSLIF